MRDFIPDGETDMELTKIFRRQILADFKSRIGITL